MIHMYIPFIPWYTYIGIYMYICWTYVSIAMQQPNKILFMSACVHTYVHTNVCAYVNILILQIVKNYGIISYDG